MNTLMRGAELDISNSHTCKNKTSSPITIYIVHYATELSCTIYEDINWLQDKDQDQIKDSKRSNMYIRPFSTVEIQRS